jgi:hypothetical protein
MFFFTIYIEMEKFIYNIISIPSIFLLNIVHQFVSVESNWCRLLSGYDAESVSNNNLNCIMCVKFALITFSP